MFLVERCWMVKGGWNIKCNNVVMIEVIFLGGLWVGRVRWICIWFFELGL